MTFFIQRMQQSMHPDGDTHRHMSTGCSPAPACTSPILFLSQSAISLAILLLVVPVSVVGTSLILRSLAALLPIIL